MRTFTVMFVDGSVICVHAMSIDRARTFVRAFYAGHAFTIGE